MTNVENTKVFVASLEAWVGQLPGRLDEAYRNHADGRPAHRGSSVR